MVGSGTWKSKTGGTVKHLVENTRPLVNGWCHRGEAKWMFGRDGWWPKGPWLATCKPSAWIFFCCEYGNMGMARSGWQTLTHLGDCFEGIHFPRANLWCNTYSEWISLHQPSVLAHWQAWCFLTCPSADATWKAWQSDGVAEREETGIHNIGKN